MGDVGGEDLKSQRVAQSLCCLQRFFRAGSCGPLGHRDAVALAHFQRPVDHQSAVGRRSSDRAPQDAPEFILGARSGDGDGLLGAFRPSAFPRSAAVVPGGGQGLHGLVNLAEGGVFQLLLERQDLLLALGEGAQGDRFVVFLGQLLHGVGQTLGSFPLQKAAVGVTHKHCVYVLYFQTLFQDVHVDSKIKEVAQVQGVGGLDDLGPEESFHPVAQ